MPVASPHDHLATLLALRLAAGAEPARLAQFLLQSNGALEGAPWPITQAMAHEAGRQAVAIRTMGIQVLPVTRLPGFLRDARPCPSMLFVRGDATLLHRPAVAIVGSRLASQNAMAWAFDYARQAAKEGVLVVSGGACGIDAAAHKGALAEGGATLAYVGSPADNIYPAKNRQLFGRMLAQGGAIASEHPPLARLASWFHAARNRFIAAHAQKLVVVEAAGKSGTLGTATYARRMGREILVPPAEVGGQREGIDALLAKGHARIA